MFYHYLTFFLLSRSEGRNIPPPSPQCHPSVVHAMPPRIRKVCAALAAFLDYPDEAEPVSLIKGKFNFDSRNI